MRKKYCQDPHEFESNKLADLPISIRHYVKGLREYQAEIKLLNEMVTKISLLAPIANWLKEIDGVILQVKRIIQNELDRKNKSDIDDLLLEESQSLEVVLDQHPVVFLPDSSVDEIQRAHEDVELLIERVVELMRAIGYKLFEYLNGSRF